MNLKLQVQIVKEPAERIELTLRDSSRIFQVLD